MALSIQPRRGRPRTRRCRLAEPFLAAIAGSQLPGWQLALLGGWTHYPAFSLVVRARAFPAASVTVERFKRLAAALGYTGPVFLTEDAS
jgi:hypothetical protein